MITEAISFDYAELLKFECSVFRVPFKLMMPKLYGDREFCTSHHRVVKQNGKIIAAYAAYPTEFVTKSGNISAVGIGSVAVSKKCRNQGLMSQMMQNINEEARENNSDICFLSGFRKRYERFGYVPAGERFVCDITEHCISHSNADKKYSFVSVRHGKKYLDEAVSLFDSQSAHWLREKENFSDIVTTWCDRSFFVLDESKRFCGYIITDTLKKSITEIVVSNTSLLTEILISFISSHSKKSASVALHPWQKEEIRILGSFGEHFRIESSAMMKFNNFKKPIEIMMNEKLKTESLTEGTVILKIDGDNLKITVKDKKCTVTECDSAPDVTFSYDEAVMALTTHYNNTDNFLFRAWSPMCPIAIPHVDMV